MRTHSSIASRIAAGAMIMAAGTQAQAAVEMPRIFGNNMVLQRDIATPIWGRAPAGEEVSVKVAGQEKKATADKDGKWLLRLDPVKAGGPYELLVAGKDNALSFKNVLFGDVWFVAGQSNAAFSLGDAEGGKEAAAAAAQYAQIRLNDGREVWNVSDEASAKAIAAIGYWFGLDVHKAMQVPIGLVGRAWGGRAAAVFARGGALETDEELNRLVWQPYLRYTATYAERKKAWDAAPADRRSGELPPPQQDNRWPGDYWTAVMSGIVPYGIKGVIWYQGESDSWGFPAANLYRHTMTVLIKDWRAQWGLGDFPFMIVQLPCGPANENDPVPPEPSPASYVQESQALLARSLPNVGYAVTADNGEADIHPLKKKPMAQRLAKAALALVYGQKIEGSGPVLREMKIEGDKVRLAFDHVGGGLVAKDNKLKGFSLAGEDRMFFWADGRIDGDSVVLSSREVPTPVAARYLFSEGCPWSLMNRDGLLASPFRTDEWSYDAAAKEKKGLTCAAAKTAPVIDGKLDDAAWKDSSAATGFTRVNTYRPAQPTTVRVTWDKANFYLAYACQTQAAAATAGAGVLKLNAGDNAMGDFASRMTDKLDAAFWQGDYIEFLIDPKSDLKNYLRFAVNPKGVLFTGKAFNDAADDTGMLNQDLLSGKRWIDKNWKGACTVKAAFADGAWTVEMAIPWTTLEVGEPKPGMKMGVQFMRNQAATGEYSEWSAAGRDRNTGAMLPARYLGGFTMFHAVSRFGILTLK